MRPPENRHDPLPAARALALCCLLPLAGCWESPLPEGVVATVNGEAIHIRTVQAYMDGNSPGLGTRNQPPDTNQLRRDYGEALSDIIIQTLAMQDLQRRGIRGVEERARDLEEEIRDDYGPGEFDSYLAEESLDPAEWRRLLRGFVALQMLEEVVLEPELRVSREEVLAYYREHEAAFRLPERYRVCLASSASKEALQQWRDAFAADRTPAVGKDVSTRCTEIPVRELTPPWNKDVPSPQARRKHPPASRRERRFREHGPHGPAGGGNTAPGGRLRPHRAGGSAAETLSGL